MFNFGLAEGLPSFKFQRRNDIVDILPGQLAGLSQFVGRNSRRRAVFRPKW
jgi:hypothetical protein